MKDVIKIKHIKMTAYAVFVGVLIAMVAIVIAEIIIEAIVK